MSFKNLILSSIVFLCCENLVAQSLPWSVIASSGDQFMSANGSLEWTLGETVTETYSQTKGFLTQGFQQPATIKVTGLEEVGKGVLIYPNPTANFLYVKVDETSEWQIEVFDLHGKRMTSPVQKVPGMAIHQVDMQGLGAAVYLLSLSNITTGKKVYDKIIKQ
jgi:hypothetical protein